MTDLDALITRLWNAEEPNRELDYLIYGWSKGWRLPSKDHPFSWTVLNKFQYGDPANDRAAIYIHESELPELTTSIDAAVAFAVAVLGAERARYLVSRTVYIQWDEDEDGQTALDALPRHIVAEVLKARGDD